jgi:hypothetical protein
MASDPDRLILTPKERQVLADLEEALHREAPDLEASLTVGRRRPAPLRALVSALHRRFSSRSAAAELLIAAVLVVAGTAVLLLTFARWLPIGLLGVAIQALGIWAGIDALQSVRARRRAQKG